MATKLLPASGAEGVGNTLVSSKTTGSSALTRRGFLAAAGTALAASASNSCGGRSPKRVVLTFDDAVKSHRTFVAPLLSDLGFQATFFVTHRWMDDAENFMSWQDIAEIHEMGFEIGNHSWTHSNFSIPRNALQNSLRNDHPGRAGKLNIGKHETHQGLKSMTRLDLHHVTRRVVVLP